MNNHTRTIVNLRSSSAGSGLGSLGASMLSRTARSCTLADDDSVLPMFSLNPYNPISVTKQLEAAQAAQNEPSQFTVCATRFPQREYRFT